jgi:hypothetical protein
VDFGNHLAVQKGIIERLFTMEKRAGGLAPLNVASAAPPICSHHALAQARTATSYIQETDAHGGAFALLDRMAAACTVNQWQGAWIRIERAKAYQSIAERNPATTGLLPRMLESARDIDAMETARMESPIGWNREAVAAFNLALFHAAAAGGYSLPMDQWFTPENLDKSWTGVAMSLALDKAWADGQAAGGDIRARTDAFRKLYGDAFVLAVNSPEATRQKAKASLYWAARRHSEGIYRRKENAALTPPPDFLWKSLYDPTQ